MPKQEKSKEEKLPHIMPHVKEEERKELAKKYLQFQLARQYLAALAEERAAVDAKLAEMSMTIGAMKKLKELKQGEEMWSTIGSDTFVMSDIRDISSAIVGVGAGVYVRKPIDQAIETLNKRHAELSSVSRQMAAELTALGEQLEKLEPEIQAMAARMQEK